MLGDMAEYSHISSFHHLHVADNNGVRTLRFERNQQSSMRLDAPYETDIEYVGYLHLTLAIAPHASRVLVVGLGGGMLVKQLWRDHPAMLIDAVELDPEVVAIARELFALPADERVRVHVADGRTFLDGCTDAYDIIVIDAFDDDHLPRPLTTEEFMRTAYERLTPGGVLAYNVIGTISGAHSKPLRSLHRTARNVWPRVWLFPVGTIDPGGIVPENVVMLASDAEISDEALHERIADRVSGRVTVPGFGSFGERLFRGAIRTGDVPIITDPPGSRRRP